MLNRVWFENFRGFRHFDANLRSVTAFLGPNSSGKTTALHAIRLACEALRLALNEDTPARSDGTEWVTVTSDAILSDHSSLLAVADWRALFVDQIVGEGVNLSIHLFFDENDPLQELEVILACARNQQLKLSVRVRSAAAIELVRDLPKKSQHISARLTDYLVEHSPVAVFVPPFYGTVTAEEYRSRAVIDRMLGSGDQSHVVRNLIIGLDVAQWERLNSFLEDTVGARLTRRTSQDELQNVEQLSVQFRDTNGELELSAAGAGLVNLISLFASLSRWRQDSAKRTVLFLLDEPEAHLHPRLQADSAERLSRLITAEFHAQLIVATHSIDILNRLFILDGLLLRCDRTSSTAVVELDSQVRLFDDISGWVDISPYTAVNFLATRRVAFCEGDDEKLVLPRLAQLKFRDDPIKQKKFASRSLVRLTGATNAPIARLLTRLVEDELVVSRAQGGQFDVLLVLDRDHARQPGLKTEPFKHVRSRTFVWPKHSLESMLLEQECLHTWIKAFVEGEVPAGLSEQIATAIEQSNRDTELNDAAVEQLIAHLAVAELVDEQGQKLGGEQRIVHAVRRAKELVAASPAVWQRGKDRGRFILGKIRTTLTPPSQNRFPTDVLRLIERTRLERIGDPMKALPADVSNLLDLWID